MQVALLQGFLAVLMMELKQLKESQQVPVILFSIHNKRQEYLKTCDAQGFLAKPFASTNLLEIIRYNLN